MTQKAFENAIMVDMALGGSTNSCLHIRAIAKASKVAVDLKMCDTISAEERLTLQAFSRVENTCWRIYIMRVAFRRFGSGCTMIFMIVLR